jgi:hypothetical protein
MRISYKTNGTLLLREKNCFRIRLVWPELYKSVVELYEEKIVPVNKASKESDI